MATVSHTIYSHYDPKEREKEPEASASQTQLQDEPAHDPWQAESSFPASRLLNTAPRFVPAKIPFDEWSTENSNQQQIPVLKGRDETGQNPADWYRALTNASRIQQSVVGPVQKLFSTVSRSQESIHVRPNKKDKNNWFIYRAIQSEPASASSTPPPTQTLADILDRDPPPLPSQEPYRPPVWLAIGPSNKGFTMLQQRGWNEGEGLGAHARRNARADIMELEGKKRTRSEPQVVVKQETREVTWVDDVQEVQQVNVIDLTLSDSEAEIEKSDANEDIFGHQAGQTATTPSNPADQSQSRYSPKVLLTPIPTILKSDRLGIGLKAKTTGPYKASQKRVTHNAAALAAHIKATKDIRKKKAELGRGHRGFAKLAKKEREARQQMLAYLNE